MRPDPLEPKGDRNRGVVVSTTHFHQQVANVLLVDGKITTPKRPPVKKDGKPKKKAKNESEGEGEGEGEGG